MRNPSIFLGNSVKWNFDNLISNLYEFIRNICKIGFYTESNHNLINHSIAHLNDKIVSAETYVPLKYWTIMPILAYAALFDCGPNLILRVCDLITRYVLTIIYIYFLKVSLSDNFN